MISFRIPLCVVMASAGIIFANASSTRAEVDASLVVKYHQASRSLMHMASRRGADLPRVTDPRARTLFDELDWRSIRHRAPYRAPDVEQLLSIQSELSPLLHLYEERRDAKGRADLLANWRIYQDELTLLGSLLLDVSVALHEAILDFMGTLPRQEITPIRLAGLKGATDNLATQVSGLLTMIDCDGITDDNRRRFSAALRRNADALARFAEAAALTSLRAAALRLGAAETRDDAIRGDLEAFGRAANP